MRGGGPRRQEAVVTGASAGPGRAIARGFAAEGAIVCAADTSGERWAGVMAMNMTGLSHGCKRAVAALVGEKPRSGLDSAQARPRPGRPEGVTGATAGPRPEQEPRLDAGPTGARDSVMDEICIDLLNRLDVRALAMTDEEILRAVETSLATRGRGEAVIEPGLAPVDRAASGGIPTELDRVALVSRHRPPAWPRRATFSNGRVVSV